MSAYHHTVVQMSNMLRSLRGCLAKAKAFADHKQCSADEFVSFRLTLDMRPFGFQIQSACDTAKASAARLAGIEAPKHEDNETTLAELEARIDKTLEFLATLTEEQFTDADEREIRLPFLPGKAARGADYLREFALPNFYFHVTTAYALLRMAGVSVGKRDYITTMTMYDLSE